MQLGLNFGYATTAAEMTANLELAVLAEELGYDVVWAAEAYGSDAVSMLAAIAARTERIDIGSAVLQIPGRTPALTAMTAASLDALSGGRFRLGLGVSGPQVSEGWHGVRFTDPIGRTREYVHIVRQAMSRRRLVAAGEHFTLPLPDGEGKALLLSLQPVRPAVPIYLAAVGPKNLALTGEIADGWLAIFFDPDSGNGEIAKIRTAAEAADRNPSTIAISVQTPAALGDTVAQAAEQIRPHAALYLGGMGSRQTNFYHRIATSMGYGAEADQVQDRFLARDYAGAAAAVPLEFLTRTCLLGDESTIADRLRMLAAGGVTCVDVGVSGQDKQRAAETLRVVRRAADQAEVLGGSRVTWLDAIILGIVEGLTEFLPVSSTGHLTIAEKLLGLPVDDPSITAFTAVIQVGAILAVVIYFWADIVRLLLAWGRGLFNPARRTDPDYRMAWLVIIGSIPIVIVGFLARDLISGPLRSLWVVAAALIVWGFFMLLGEWVARQDRGERDLNLVDVLLIGIAQCLALVPGVSRSGATISVGLMRGLDRVTATRLAFLLGIPALVGAGAYELPSALSDGGVGWGPTLVGTVVSFVVAYATVAWLLKYVAKHSIAVFVWYRWALGAALIVALSTGWLAAT